MVEKLPDSSIGICVSFTYTPAVLSLTVPVMGTTAVSVVKSLTVGEVTVISIAGIWMTISSANSTGVSLPLGLITTTSGLICSSLSAMGASGRKISSGIRHATQFLACAPITSSLTVVPEVKRAV